MGWNGSGTFTRNYSWVNDAANNIPITASRVDADMNDVVGNGLNNCITRDGQGSPTANLPMNGFKHTGAAAGVANSDYVTMGQISGFAPLASPSFTGTPLAPTATAGTSTTQIATTAFVNNNYLALAGGTMTGNLTVNNTIFAGTVNVTSNLGAGNVISNGTVVANGGTLQVGNSSGTFITMNYSGQFSSSISVTGNITANSNITANGVFFSGSTQQPTIFVQSGTPTARNVGDLWFF